jgi:tetratricopeptide (TPR) repeat protein
MASSKQGLNNGTRTGTGDGGEPTSQEEKLSRDARAVFYGFLSLGLAGLIFVAFDQWGPTWSAAILWSMACLAIGSLIGFLFGIPRVLQAEASGNPSQSNSTASPTGQARASTQERGVNRLGVNTNLEQISDWLTKIFVGLGLVQLQRAPDHLSRAAAFISSGLAPDSKFFAGGLLLYFSVLGFLGFYLLTRLYFAAAFARADRESSGAFSRSDIQVIQSAPTPIAGEQRALTSEVKQAARRVVSRAVDELSSTSDTKAWAKAQLTLGDYSKAIDVYAKLVAQEPDNIILRLEYAAALFQKGDRAGAKNQLIEAYKRITSNKSRDDKERVYAALTYQSLYEPPPNGFEEAIKYGEEYVRDAQNLQSGRIWVNLASAYGQRMAWILQHDPENELSKTDTRSKALNAVKRAVAMGAEWKEKLLELLQHDYPNKDPQENDLEVFEKDNEFREVLGLPPV